MGQGGGVQVALSKLVLRDRDCLLLCSDGLTGALSDAEVRDEILGSRNLDEACERLVAKANQRGGADNITVVVAGVSGDLPLASADERVSTTHEILESFAPPGPPQRARARIVPATVKMTH